MRHEGGMRSLDRRRRALAALLAALAGYVDAVGFIASGGFFLSFMSGNSTRLGVGLLGGPSGAALFAGGVMAAFVAGVLLASLLTGGEGAARQRRVLLLVALLLVGAALGLAAMEGPVPFLMVAAAMGAANTAFEETGDVRFGITYMTGTLVRLGLRLAALVRGEDRDGWRPLAGHWLTLVTGAVLGAAAWPLLGPSALWPAAALAALLALPRWQAR
jgi:uncharacterized membrane protein YoaK (UPF0700 family)